MYSLNSRKRFDFQKYRPVLIAGLYFFLYAAEQLSAQDVRLFREFTPLFTHTPLQLTDLPDSSLLRLHSTFNPLYSEKDRATHGDRRTVGISTRGYSVDWFSRFRQVNYYLSCNRNAATATYRDTSEDYGCTYRSVGWNLAAGATYRNGNLLFGFGLGRHWPERMEQEHLYEIRDDVTTYITRGPWQFTLDTKWFFSRATTRLSLFSGPIHSSVSKLITSDEMKFRSFPLTLILHRADGGFDFYTGTTSAATTFGIDYFENADLQTVHNSMPQDIAISNFRLDHSGYTKVPFTDSLGWNLSGSLAGGWVASYNFERNRFTFFKADEIRLRNLSVGIGTKLPAALTAGIFHTSLKGNSPTGFLKLSALSAWSIFRPLDYQYTNAELRYHETGGFINRKCTLSFLEVTPQLALSYFTAHATATYSHKEIVVLLPVYIDTVAKDFFDIRLLLLEPALRVSSRLGRIQFYGTISQKLPFPFKTAPSAEQGTSPEANHQISTTTWGGTMMAISAVWDVRRSGIANRVFHRAEQ